MAKIERTITMNAPVDEVFGFASDIGRLWRLMPGVETHEIVVTPDLTGSHAEWDFRLVGPLHVEGRIDYTEVVAPDRIVATSSTGPVFTLAFSPHGTGTEVHTVVEWNLGAPVVGVPLEALTMWMSRHDISTWMTRLKAAVEGVEPEEVLAVPEESPGRLTRSVVVDAPVERVFADVLNLGTFWTGSRGVATRDVKLTSDGVGSSARIYSHWLGLHMEGDLEVVEATPDKRVVIKAAFGPESPLWTFDLEPAARGTTLTGTGEWHMEVPGIGQRLEAWAVAMHEDFLEEMLASAKDRVEAAELVTH